jgi:hypothetical protein
MPVAPSTFSGRPRRKVVLEAVPPAEIELRWRPRFATTVLERRLRDGRLIMSVDHVPAIGYRIYAPRVGRHLVAADGGRILSALPRLAPWRWQRLLIAQVLPLAATLQGLELLHASAVDLGGAALAFVARSGTGKTSVAAHLVAGGASLVTDDVLAFEPDEGGVLAHPGAHLLAVSPAELTPMTTAGRRRLGTVVGRGDKAILEVAGAEERCRLGAIFFLVRSGSGRDVGIEQLSPAPARLLSNSFNTYVGSQRRVVNQLTAYSRLAQSVPMYEVTIPPSRPAADVAASIREFAKEEL